MKKVWALLLTLVMALSLTACGGGTDTKGNDSQPETQEEEQNQTFVPGTVSGDTYTSEGLGVKFVIDENWAFLNEEEIGELTGMVQDLTDDAEVKEALEDGESLYDMYAMTKDGSGRTANVTVSDLGALFGKVTTEDVYAESVAKELPDMFESVGATNLQVEPTTYTFAGEEHSGIHVVTELQGVEVHEGMVCVKDGRFVYNVTCAAQSEEALAGVMAMFNAQ